MKDGILRNELFVCDHLGSSAHDEKDIMSFSVKHQSGLGLVSYLRYHAFPDERIGNMRTYMVRDIRTCELACYFSLKAGLISVNEVITENGIEFDTLPGVELANFAVNYTYIRNHKNLKGLGNIIFTDFVVPIIENSSDNIGIRIIYLFALPENDLIQQYEKNYGFTRLEKKAEEELHRRLKPGYDESCIFMYQSLK